MLKQKIYWKVSYRESMRDEFINDRDLTIAQSDYELLDKEFWCLKKHKIKIIETNYEMGYAVIEEEIKVSENIFKTYKNKDIVPYIELRPVQRLSDKEGNVAENGKYKIS